LSSFTNPSRFAGSPAPTPSSSLASAFEPIAPSTLSDLHRFDQSDSEDENVEEEVGGGLPSKLAPITAREKQGTDKKNAGTG
jgi:hypothetical protein